MQRRLSSRARAVNIWLMAPLLGFAVFLVIFTSLTRPAQAATSSNLNFQARLLNSVGGIVADGNYNIDFKIYNADSTTGSVGTCTGACLWEETRKNSNSQGVTVINGYFSVNLGSVTAFPAINWDQPLWLTMNIGGTSTGASPTWDGEMQNAGHSIALTALPYSFVAGQLAKSDGSGHRGVLGFNTVANNPSITLPDASGTLCLQAASACGFESTSGTDFIKNSAAGPQNANFNIQSAASGSIGGLITGASGQSVDIFEVKANGVTDPVFKIGSTGDANFETSSASATAFRIQKAAGSDTLFTADTSTNKIVIGNSTGTDANVTLLTLDNSTADPATGYAGAMYYNTSTGKFRCYSTFWDNCGVSGTFLHKDSTDTSTADAGSGYLYTFTNSGSAGTGGVLSLDNGNNTGSVLNVKGTGTAAFKVQSASNISLLTADTTNMRISIGTAGTATGQLYVAGGLPSSSLSTVTTDTQPNQTVVQGHYAYIVNTSTATLQIVDITTPSSPSTIYKANPGSALTAPATIAVAGHYAYVGNVSSGTTINAFDISNPKAPTLSATVTSDTEPHWLDVEGRYLYVTTFTGNSIEVYDLANPASPVKKGDVTLPSSGRGHQVFVQGKYAYVTDNLNAKVLIYDISNPSSPAIMNGTGITTGSGTRGIWVDGRYAYVVSSSGIQVFDVSDPTTTAAAVGTLALGTTPYGIIIQGRYAYVTNSGSNTLQIVDVSNPASPASIGTVATNAGPRALTVSGRYAFVPNSGGGTGTTMQIFDLGGSYAQQLQAGGIETGTLQVDGNGQVAGSFNIQGGLSIGQGLQVNGNIGSNGQVLFQNSSNSSAAFQVQNTGGQSILGVDTSNNQLLLGQSNSLNGSILFKNSTSTNGITINSTGTSSNYTLTLPTVAPAGGLCIETSTGNASQLIFASCSNNNASIQEVNEWDANSTNVVSVSPSTAGDEMVLTTQIPTGGVSVSSISGGGVTTWNKIISNAGNGTVNRVEMWAGTVTTTGSSNITVTYSSSPGAEEVAATEFTAAGVNANTSWGIESSAAQLNSTSSATVTYPNMTAVNGSELYVGYAQVQNPPATAGSTTGFNYIQTSTQHNMITYNTSLAANTAYQPTANQNTSGQSNSVAAILTAFVTSSSINNTTSLQKANFYVQAATSGTVAGVLQAASSGTADILDLRNSGSTNVLSVGSTGNVVVQPAASASAFKVLNGSSYSVLGVDTSGNQVTLGDATHLSGKITFADSGDSNTISLVAPSSVASSYSLTLPNNTPTAGLCLGTSPSNANQLIFASCATSVSAASISYINKWDNHGTSVTTISDSPGSVGNLLVFYSHAANAVTVSSISGGGVTNWTKITAYTGGGTPGNIEMWRGVVTTTGAGTITVTYSAAAGTNEIAAQEFSMGSSSGTWAIDTSGTATNTGSVTTVNYPTLTPLNSSELYTGYAYGGGTMSAGSSSGFTYVATGGSKYLAYDTNVTGGTAYTPTATQTASVYASVGAVIAAYAGTSVIVNSTAVQQANFNVQAATSGTVAGILQAASSGSADVFQAKDSSGNNVMSINASTGLTLGTPSVLAGSLVFAASGNNNTITITSPSTPGASYSLTLPTTTPAAGQCLATSPSNANQLVFSSCANQVTSVAISFVNSWKSSGNNITTLSVSPASLNNLMVLFSSPRNGVSVSTVSGGGVATWSKVSGSTAGSGADTSAIDMWKGVVTSTGSSTITVTFSGSQGNPNELAAMEFTTGSTTGSWVVDASNTQFNSSASTTMTFPSLTPQSSKDLYVGYGAGGTYSSGGSSGFTYITGSLTNRVGLYNTNVSTTTQPTATTASSSSLTVGALVAAYSSSSVISNSTVTQQGNFNVQAATSGSVAGTLQAFVSGTGDIFDLLDGGGTLVGSVSSTGNLLVKPSTASAAAFQVQTTGGVNVLSADTSGKQVVVGAGATGESSPSLLVLDNETGTSSDPTEVNGAMYYNATTHTFRCGVAGAWQNCGGLLYANTSKSSANSNCSSACVAFSTAASVPANYCQAGKVIRISANGYFSSQATATNIQFGIYYGTDASVAANDVLIGSVSPAVSVTSASNNYFQINLDINCFSTTSMQAGGALSIQTGTAAAGLTALPLNATSAATVVTTSTKNLYIFPIWSAASASNTATLAQFGVNSP